MQTREQVRPWILDFGMKMLKQETREKKLEGSAETPGGVAETGILDFGSMCRTF